jgi:hypothetical protein
MDRTKNISYITAYFLVAGETCPQSGSVATAVVLLPSIHSCYLAVGLHVTVFKLCQCLPYFFPIRKLLILKFSVYKCVHGGQNVAYIWHVTLVYILHSDSITTEQHVWCTQVAACIWCAHGLSATSTGAGSARRSGPATVWVAIGSDRHKQGVQKKSWQGKVYVPWCG